MAGRRLSLTTTPSSSSPPSRKRSDPVGFFGDATSRRMLVDGGLRVSKCWDIAAVQRLLVGGWRMDPARAWAMLHDLSIDELPVVAAVDLFSEPDDGLPDEPLRVDGYIKPEWLTTGFDWTTERLGRWAQLAATAATLQGAKLAGLTDRPNAASTARSESAAELLCAELSSDGLPMDRAIAESIVASFVGPRPRDEAEAIEQRRSRDAEVLRHSTNANLRSAQSRAGEITAAQHRRRTARHPRVASRSDPRHASVDRRAPGVAQGRADCDDVRVRLARREPRIGRPVARRVVCVRWRCGSHDCVSGSAQHAGPPPLGRGCRGRPRVCTRRSRPDRTAHPGRGLRRLARLPRRRRRTTCICRSPSNWPSIEQPRRSQCSAQCTGRRRDTAQRHCAGWSSRTPWPCDTSRRPTSPGRSAATSVRTADD